MQSLAQADALQQTMKRPTMQSWLRHSDFETVPRLPPLCSGRGCNTVRMGPLPQKQLPQRQYSEPWYPEILT